MLYLEPKGRDWGSIVNWDDLGKLYAGFIITWTLLLVAGASWLVLNRQLPFIRIRNLPLMIASTAFLHVYLVKILLAYTTNGHFLCSAEFWIMSIYLPFGIALYQAYLVQLRSIWEQQQSLVLRSSSGESIRSASSTGLISRWQRLSRLHKSYFVISCFMVVQLVVTGVLYATTPTLQGDWTSYGKISHAKGQSLCRKSLQWVPSAFWQLFWSWFYGPYTLWEVRHIRDIHFWRAQVIVSVISGLPGSPLWLAALYSPVFKPVNKRWVPPMWLAPGIIVMQFVTVFFPIYEAWLSRRDMKRTLSMLQAWDRSSEAAFKDAYSFGTSTPKTSVDGTDYSRQSISPNSETRINTMESLRKTLSINPVPLLDFAATKDFTAENILFLVQVRRWRQAWATASKGQSEVAESSRAGLFDMAAEIYETLISERTADFPINIESKIKLRLDSIFEAATPNSPSLSATSFDDALDDGVPRVQRMALRHLESSDSEKTLWNKTAIVTIVEPLSDENPLVKTTTSIKDGFDEHVFDDAERSIEYLVLTNTWQKFVKEGNARRIDC
ncbi:hypothetical protein LTS08_008326 [Lithohypha guttulata]|nr:hypothetical protein LTS08_008326 [Lithohypha guttulata]